MRVKIILLLVILLVAGCAAQVEEEKDPIISLALTNTDFKDLCYGLSLDNPDGSEKVVSMKYEKEGSGEIYEVKCLSERVFTDGTYACLWYPAFVNTTAKTVKGPTVSDTKSKAGKCSEENSIISTSSTAEGGPLISTKEDALNAALSKEYFKSECEKMKQSSQIEYHQLVVSGTWKGYSVLIPRYEKGVAARFLVQCGIEKFEEVGNRSFCYYAEVEVSPAGDVGVLGKAPTGSTCPTPIRN